MRRRRTKTSRWPWQASVNGLIAQLRAHGFEHFVTEYRFDKFRRFRFDVAWPDKKCALEYDGGFYQGLGHSRPVRFRSDMEKSNLAVLQGWRVLRFGPDEVRTGQAAIVAKELFDQ